DSVARGKLVYAQMKCSECHGDDGKGDGPSASTLRDNWGDPILPRNFTLGGSAMKSGPTPQDIYKAFSTGLDGTPMPSYADFLNPDQRWDLVHYVMSYGPADTYLIITQQQQQ
ncbi:MAG: c-type cytochrome, partial [Candidatus Acidiferrales bacterium]